MALAFTVGGTAGTFEVSLARELASVLDNAFGAEGDWEGMPPRSYGALNGKHWSQLQAAAAQELGEESIPNLLALGSSGRGVYVPSHVRVVNLPISAGTLACASLPGLRRELAELATRWDIAVDDESLLSLTQDADDAADLQDVALADAPEVMAFALLSLAANEAVRRDCPLWIVG